MVSYFELRYKVTVYCSTLVIGSWMSDKHDQSGEVSEKIGRYHGANIKSYSLMSSSKRDSP